MTAHWNTIQPTIIHFDGRIYHVPDHIAFNWMHSGSACAHIKYCFCVLIQAATDPWQYDDFWQEWIALTKDGENPHDSLAWSKKFEVLSISRLLLESLGIPHDQVASLTDDEMDKLAERLQAQYISPFYEKVRIFVRVYLAERNEHYDEHTHPDIRRTG